MGQRRDALRDAGGGPDLLAGFDRPAEKGVEHRAHGAFVPCGLPGVPDLAQDLVLAHHHRVEPGGDPEQMLHRFGVVKGIELVGDGLGGESRELGEHLADVGVAAVEALGVGVDLGAVAGGKQHRLAEMGGRRQLVERFGQVAGRDRHPLKQIERRGSVITTDDYQRH